ncbi:MAG: H-type lectin domain-containing protein [Mogibacterium sp.]|nr:H-type lectin domain-containing protein [Mogibacterium sp.]
MNTLSSILKFIGNRFNRIQGGYLSGQNVGANSYLDRQITFPNSYSSAPAVAVTLSSTSEAGEMGQVMAAAINVTTTGFTVRVFNAGTATRTPALHWIAIP